MEKIDIFQLYDLGNEYKQKESNDWKWSFKDYPPKNGLKVFSCFAGGGGSTMGYKLCGCDVLGCNEIDPKMNEIYVKNHKPKYNFLEDLRTFNNRTDLPQELYDLDILDGSPPCSTFSMAGEREKSWGKKKKFREGQKEQTLDDLLFVFIETVKKLEPKVAIIENVEGLLKGNAFKYTQKIYKKYHEIGYQVKHWLLKGENMGVPQTRHRVFFVATRLNFDLENIDMNFNYKPITYGIIKEGVGKKASIKAFNLLNEVKECEKNLSKAHERLYSKKSWFNHVICFENKVMPTIVAGHSCMWRFKEKTQCSNQDFINGSTFPQDYDFGKENISYICGMSVPPIMIKRLIKKLIESGLFDYKLKGENKC